MGCARGTQWYKLSTWALTPPWPECPALEQHRVISVLLCLMVAGGTNGRWIVLCSVFKGVVFNIWGGWLLRIGRAGQSLWQKYVGEAVAPMVENHSRSLYLHSVYTLVSVIWPFIALRKKMLALPCYFCGSVYWSLHLMVHLSRGFFQNIFTLLLPN